MHFSPDHSNPDPTSRTGHISALGAPIWSAVACHRFHESRLCRDGHLSGTREAAPTTSDLKFPFPIHNSSRASSPSFEI